MAYTERKRQSNQRWDRANLDRMSVALPAGTKGRVEVAAEAQGLSVNGWLRGVILEALEAHEGPKQQAQD